MNHEREVLNFRSAVTHIVERDIKSSTEDLDCQDARCKMRALDEQADETQTP
jgi:hypothetical protein